MTENQQSLSLLGRSPVCRPVARNRTPFQTREGRPDEGAAKIGQQKASSVDWVTSHIPPAASLASKKDGYGGLLDAYCKLHIVIPIYNPFFLDP